MSMCRLIVALPLLALLPLPAALGSPMAAQNEPRALETIETLHPEGTRRERFEAYRAANGEPVRHGKYESWHPNGERFERGSFTDGVREGRWTQTHATGRKAAVGSYRAGHRNGKWEFFDEDGDPDAEQSGLYEFERLEPGPGRLRAEGERKDGRRHGPWSFYWEDGSVQFAGDYVEDRQDGPWLFRHRDGSADMLMLSGLYIQGRRVRNAADLGRAYWRWNEDDMRRETAPRITSLADLPPWSVATPPGAEFVPLLDAMFEYTNRGFDDEDSDVRRFDPLATMDPAVRFPHFLNRLREIDVGTPEGRASFQRCTPLLLALAEVMMLPTAAEEGSGEEQHCLALANRLWSLWSLVKDNPTFLRFDLAEFGVFKRGHLLDAQRAMAKREAGAPSELPAVLFAPPVPDVSPTVGQGGGGWGDHPAYASRTGRRKEREDKLLDRGLQWLADHQLESGAWDADGIEADCPRFGPRELCAHDVGVSGLALLALLGDGNTSTAGRHRDAVLRGARYLIGIQDEAGAFVAWQRSRLVYDQAIATLALCELAAVTASPAVRHAAQGGVDYLLRIGSPVDAWSYDAPTIGNSDTSVTAWVHQALRAAQWAGLKVDEQRLDATYEWYAEVIDPATGRAGYDTFGSPSARYSFNEGRSRDHCETPTAAALFVCLLDGEGASFHPCVDKSLALLDSNPPAWDDGDAECDMIYWYYGLHALRRLGDQRWNDWWRVYRKAAAKRQCTDLFLEGSWEPAGVWGMVGGRIYATAITLLALEAPYRLAPPGRTR